MHEDERDDCYVVDCRLRRGGALDDEAFGTGGSNRMRRTGSTPGVRSSLIDVAADTNL